EPVGRAQPVPHPAVAGGEHLEGEPRGPLTGNREPGAADQVEEAAPGEEADVAAIEDPPLIVIKEADRRSHPRVPMPEVGNRGDESAPWNQHGANLLEQALRVSHMLQD